MSSWMIYVGFLEQLLYEILYVILASCMSSLTTSWVGLLCLLDELLSEILDGTLGFFDELLDQLVDGTFGFLGEL